MSTSTLQMPSVAAKNEQATNSSRTIQLVDPYANGKRRFEIVKGKVVEKQMGLIENLVASRLYGRLDFFCRDRTLGHTAIEVSFSIPGTGNDRIPDVAFISYAAWAANRPIPRVNAWAVAPDLCVEVISPNDKAFEILEKVHEYFGGGVKQVWQIYSHVKQVWIYDSPSTVRILNLADELVGDPIVPGFRMQVAELFPLMEPEA